MVTISMISADQETVFPLGAAAKRVEKITGRRHNASTIYRWASRGLKGVRLETRKMGGCSYTSMEAINRFFDRLSQEDGAGTYQLGKSEIHASRASCLNHEAAEREAERCGL